MFESTLAYWKSCMGGRRRPTRRPPRHLMRSRPLHLERLEDRTVPTARAVAGAMDFGSLKIDPNTYDASSILVRFRQGADHIRGDDILRGTEIGTASTLVSGLHIVELNGVGVADALRAYRASNLVEYVEPNSTVRIMQHTNEAY